MKYLKYLSKILGGLSVGLKYFSAKIGLSTVLKYLKISLSAVLKYLKIPLRAALKYIKYFSALIGLTALLKFLGRIIGFCWRVLLKYFGVTVGLLSSIFFGLTIYGKYYAHGGTHANIEHFMLYNGQMINFDITVIIFPGFVASILLLLLSVKDFFRK